MKKTLVTSVLVLAAVIAGQGFAHSQAQPAAPQQPAAPGQPAAQPGQAAQPQKKEIKDPAEYNAYVGAVQQQDPAAKSAAWKLSCSSIPTA